MFLVGFAVSSLLGSGGSASVPQKDGKKKKKKNKSSKKVEGAGQDSKPEASKPKANKAEPPKESKPKDVKAAPAPEAKKPKAKKSEPKPDKEQPKKQAPKKSGGKAPKPVIKKAQLNHEAKHDDSDSDDEYDLASLLPGSRVAADASKAFQMAQPVEDEDSDDPEKWLAASKGGAESKSQQRRRKEKAKKATFEAEAVFEQSQKPQYDNEGFESVIVKRRVKKPVVASAVAATDGAAGDFTNSEDIPCEPKNFGLLIGPGGATLKKFQEACNVRITIPNRESDIKTINIAGEASDIAKCKSNINHLITKGYCAVTDPNTTSTSLSVQPKQLGMLIGPGGKNIKALQEKLLVKINTPDREAASSKVTISGEKANVKACKEAIHSLLEYGFSSYTHPGWVATEVEFPAEVNI